MRATRACCMGYQSSRRTYDASHHHHHRDNFAELVGIDMTPEQVDKVFAEVDLDHDGKLAYTEVCMYVYFSVWASQTKCLV